MRNLEHNIISHYTNVDICPSGYRALDHITYICAIGSHSSQPSTYDIQCVNSSMLLLGRGSLCGMIVEASECMLLYVR